MVFCKSFRIWLWVLLGFSGATQATTLLNGIALHRELGRDQFWGALYTELPSDNAEVLITSPVAKRMELKILAAEGMTLRRFSRMWIEGAAINNASGVLMAQADNMVTFDSFFGGRFETNDHIVLRFVPGEGVDVEVNSVRLGNIPDDNFFPLLLHAWLGSVPLSSGYREDLLKMGDVESGLRHAYLRLEPRLTRIAVVKGWIEQNTSEAENDSEITVAAATIAPAPSIKSHHQPDQSRDVKATIVPVPVPVPAPVSVAGAVTETRTKARMASVERVVAEARDVEAEERYSAITSQTLLARQLYISEVLGRIYARVDYPRRAQQLQQTGAIKFNLVIDGEGKIKSLKPIETSSYILLNKAAEEAVKDAAPFAPLPEILEDGELELFVPIRFSLTSSS